MTSDCQIAQNLQLPPGLGKRELRNGIGGVYQVRMHRAAVDQLQFLDTYEWNLWFSGRLLYRTGEDLRLCDIQQDWLGDGCCRCVLPPATARFAWEYEEPLQQQLAPITRLRALLPVADVTVRTTPVDLLNPERKTVCRLELTAIYEKPGQRLPFYRLCRVHPLRGYDADALRAIEVLKAVGAAEIEQGPLGVYFAKRETTPQPYTLKPVFGFTPDMPARQACRIAIGRLLTIARDSEQGVIDDVDVEFLHDYRVCIRRIRSLLSLLKDVYPERTTRRLKEQFKSLQQQTNRLRDLDVYLLARDDFTRRLPESLREGLRPMFRRFARERSREFLEVQKYLRSATYKRRISKLIAFFEDPDTLPPSANRHQPIQSIVCSRIRSGYEKVLRAQKGLDAHTPDEQIHRLRIRGKKLRYLIEFAGELFPAEEIQEVLRDLKRLQTCLGDFNDYSVQQQSLLELWDSLSGAKRDHDALALAVGGLIGALYQKQIAERAAIEVELRRFCNRKVRAEFKRLYSKSKAAAT